MKQICWQNIDLKWAKKSKQFIFDDAAGTYGVKIANYCPFFSAEVHAAVLEMNRKYMLKSIFINLRQKTNLYEV